MLPLHLFRLLQVRSGGSRISRWRGAAENVRKRKNWVLRLWGPGGRPLDPPMCRNFSLVSFDFQVRLQTQPIVNPVYNGLADCFIKTLKWEGIGGLYKGVGMCGTIEFNLSTIGGSRVQAHSRITVTFAIGAERLSIISRGRIG